MSILFGTDGIRGTAGVYPVTAEFFFHLGKVLAKVFKYYPNEGSSPKFFIAKDTRISSDMLEHAMICGFISMGCDVIAGGNLSTPAVAYLTKKLRVEAGVMITGSHNPYQDNGVKIFDSLGYKVSDEVQEHIEKFFINKIQLGEEQGGYGRVFRPNQVEKDYCSLLKEQVAKNSFKGLKIALDCSHGVAGCFAPKLFKDLGADIKVIGDKPDGFNINKRVGATCPQALQELVKKSRADIGVAFDGDADRVVFVDDKARVINGDKILGFCAIVLKEQGTLANDTVVLTQMANLGVVNSLRSYGINVVSTLVGDRYVMERMRHSGYSLGGEGSGHIIFANASSTGDGVLSAIKVIDFIFSNRSKAREIIGKLEVYPYRLLSLEVENKPPIETLPELSKVLTKCKKDLADKGRYLLRYSGTENKIRILVEAKSEGKVEQWVDKIANVIKKELG